MMRLMCTAASAIVVLTACANKPSAGAEAAAATADLSTQDTVLVPEGVTGEDSIVYLEDARLRSPLTAAQLLGLTEIHAVEGMLNRFNNEELAAYNPEEAELYKPTPRDLAALRLANRFMRMGDVVRATGSADDKLQWALAMQTALADFRKAVPSLPADSTLDEMTRVADKFSSETQFEMNYISSIYARIDYYRAIEAYRQWLSAVPAHLKPLAQEEYAAWHDLNEARFAFWNDVSYQQEWYSMKPMEINGYYGNLAENRCEELAQEQAIILQGKAYRQKGKTVTTKVWEKWIADNSVPEDADDLKKWGQANLLPDKDTVAERVKGLKAAFSRWLKARQAMAAALPEEQGKSYDSITADIHSRMVGLLPDIVLYDR